MPIPEKYDNASDNFGPYMNKQSILKEQDIEENHRDLIDKSLDTKSYIEDSLSGRMPQDGLFISELLSFLKKVRFNE